MKGVENRFMNEVGSATFCIEESAAVAQGRAFLIFNGSMLRACHALLVLD